MRISVWPIALIAALACDVGSFDPGEPIEVDLTGDWLYRAELIGNLETCEVIGLVIHIEHVGRTLTGSTEGGTAECIFPDQVVRVPLESRPLRDGEIVAGRFTMSFGEVRENQRWRHAGDVVTPVLLQGATDMTRDFGGDIGVVEFPSGSWTANRQ